MYGCANKKCPKMGRVLICRVAIWTVAFNKCYAAFVQVVWCHFNAYAFANVDPDARLAHFATYGGQNFVPIFKFYTKHSVGQFVFDSATENDYIIFCHKIIPWIFRIFWGYDIVF